MITALVLAACSHASQLSSSAASGPPAEARSTTPGAMTAPVATPAPFAVQVTGHGPPMILIPGLASSGDVWTGTVAHVREHFTCHVLTIAGFAGQPRIADPMLATVRDALAKYITAQKLERPVIVGHSLGGFLALDLAQAHPELVGRLVIVDSLPFLAAAMNPAATPESMRAAAPAIRKGLQTGSPEARRAQLGGMIPTMVTAPADQATVLDWGLRSDASAVADWMIEILTRDLRPQLPAITAPAIVLASWHGQPGETRDEVSQLYAAQYAALRGAEIVLAERARHFIMLDEPDFLYAQLDRFLARSER